MYALWVGPANTTVSLPEVVDGAYWVTAYQPSTGAFVEFPYRVPESPIPPLVLHPRTTDELRAALVSVSGGSFRMGSDERGAVEYPSHNVEVAPFLLGDTEVTAEAFDRYLAEVQPFWGSERVGTGGRPDPAAAEKPVTGVTFDQAAEFAAWYGCRLPSEEELEWTARGADGRDRPANTPPDWKAIGPAWESLHPVRAVAEDRSLEPAAAPIFGLYGNAAEITLYRFHLYNPFTGPASDSSTGRVDGQNRRAWKRVWPGHAIRSGIAFFRGVSQPRPLGYIRRGLLHDFDFNEVVGFRLARSLQPAIDPAPPASLSSFPGTPP